MSVLLSDSLRKLSFGVACMLYSIYIILSMFFMMHVFQRHNFVLFQSCLFFKDIISFYFSHQLEVLFDDNKTTRRNKNIHLRYSIIT